MVIRIANCKYLIVKTKKNLSTKTQTNKRTDLLQLDVVDGTEKRVVVVLEVVYVVEVVYGASYEE